MASPHPATEHDGAFPRGKELLGIFGFWLIFAAVTSTNVFSPPGGDGPPPSFANVAPSLTYALLWALITPAIFWLTRRFSVETSERAARIALYLGVGVLVALGVAVLMETLRHQVFAPHEGFPGQRGRFDHGGPQGRGGGGGGSIWMGARGHLFNEFTVYAAMATAGIARDYFLRYQRRLHESSTLRTQLAEARLTALHNQLNPHFLFNTLNAVTALVERDPAGVRRMIARLSDLLRATLETGGESEVALSRELTLASRYLEILEIRFEGRLTTGIDAPADVQEALVPQLILQPVIENAMTHAVGRTSAPSRIQVTVVRDGYDLVLRVSDTGAGGAAPSREGTGIGLANTRARLHQLYADEQDLSLETNDVGGTTVRIRLPYHTTPVT